MPDRIQLTETRITFLEEWCHQGSINGKTSINLTQRPQPVTRLRQRNIHMPASSVDGLANQGRRDACGNKEARSVIEYLHRQRARRLPLGRKTFRPVKAYRRLY